jgi:hypothetical protein
MAVVSAFDFGIFLNCKGPPLQLWARLKSPRTGSCLCSIFRCWRLCCRNLEDTEGTVFEIPKKAPPKMGYLTTLSKKFKAGLIQFVQAAIRVAYVYTLFVSDGILHGVNALAQERRTWEEVRNMSLNFFLVALLLELPLSPTIHPMLEGVFNLLLVWAAMFPGFLSD